MSITSTNYEYMDNLITFRKCSGIEEAEEYHKVLLENGIHSSIISVPPGVDLTFLGSTVGHEYEIHLLETDFDLANSILTTYEEQQIVAIENEHYLYQFSNDELLEVLIKPDEWNKMDYNLAKNILLERGQPVDVSKIESLRKARLEQLARPEKSKSYIITLGYTFAFLGGLLGVVIGYAIWRSKKTLPNGDKVWTYIEKDRQEGKIIFFIGIIIFCIAYIWKVVRNFNL